MRYFLDHKSLLNPIHPIQSLNSLDLKSLLFRAQIDRHFNEFSSTDMTIEKLQKIVTCPVEASFKAKWLHWWNAPFRERMDNKFPVDKPLRERALDDWLHKASFWAQVNPFPGLL